MVKSVSVIPLYFYMLIAGLIFVTGLIIIGRASMSARRKQRLNPSDRADIRRVTAIKDNGASDVCEAGTLTRRPLLTATETKFFRALQEAVGTRYIPQLPLWTMIEMATGRLPFLETESVLNE